VLLGLAAPTSGAVWVRGRRIPAERGTALARVGAIVDEPRFYLYLTAKKNLEVWASLIGRDAYGRIPAALDRVGLGKRADDKVSRYSQGMRQRLGVARCLLSEPELLILDEPTNGLDPAGMAEFRVMVRRLVEDEGRTVFLSSHLLDEVEKMCDRVAIVNRGRTVIEGSMRDLIEAGESGLLLDTDDPGRAAELLTRLADVEGIDHREDGRLLVRCDRTRETAIRLNRALVDAGVGVASLSLSEQTLEQRYLEITGDTSPSDAHGDGR